MEPDYKRLFESAAGLYVVFDRDLRIVAASDAYLRAIMMRREKVIGRTLAEVLPDNPTDPQARGLSTARRTIERVFDEGAPDVVTVEKYDIPKQGGGYEERYWNVVSVPVRDAAGQVAYVLSSLEDVTQSRAQRLMREAAESEQRYRALFNSIDAGFCVIEMMYDRQGQPCDYRFLEVNPAFARLTGLRDPTRRTMREHAPGHEQHWFDTFARVARSGEPARFVEEAKAAGRRWCQIYAFRVGGPGSQKVAVLFNDITERVHAEQGLKAADRRKDEFLATLAHELRNPLAPIRNAVELLRLKGPHTPELAEARDLIDRQVDYLVRLVDDLLDVSRITFGKITLRRARLDLRAAAEDAVSASRPAMEAARQRLSLQLPGEPVWVDGDQVRLAQVVSNLLLNASRYTPPGGHIALRADAVGEEARLTVTDNGAGIAPDKLSRIFEPFVQLGEPGTGLGIGLALVRALVELHGGRVRAQSDGPGKGSCFDLRLPLAAQPSAGAPARTPPPPPAKAPARRVLVVDDNVEAASTQAQLLRLLGHEAAAAYSGEEALQKAALLHPDVVLLDLGMPGMDGFEVARRLRASADTRRVTLIAQTGWGQDEDRRRTAAAGFDAHLTKPIELDTLVRALAATHLAPRT